MPRLETFIRIANVLDSITDELLEGVIDRGYGIRMTKILKKKCINEFVCKSTFARNA